MFVAFALWAICNSIWAQDQLTVGDVSIHSRQTREVSIELTNEATYVGFQFDLYLPEGITVEAYGAGSRLPSGTNLQMARQADGSYRFVAAALSGSPIAGNSGAVASVTLQAGDNVAEGAYTGYLRNIKLSMADGTGPTTAEQSFAISVYSEVATPTFSRVDNTVYITSATPDATIRYTLDGSTPDATSTVYADGIVVDRNLTVKAYAARRYFTDSEVAEYQVDWFKVADVAFTQTGNQVALSTTTPDAAIFYTLSTDATGEYQYGGTPLTMTGDCTIEAYATRDGYTTSDVTRFEFHAAGVTVSNPVFAHEGNIITITTTTDGADIYYTTDGTEPTAQSIRYTQPFEVDRNGTLKAIALRSDWFPSQVTDYQVDWFKVADVAFTQMDNQVALSTSTPDAAIFYTLSTDATGEHQYGGTPLTMTGDCTIEAWATRDGYNPSDTTRFEFHAGGVTVSNPVFAHEGNIITITTTTDGADIYYTTDGTEPTAQGIRYTQPFEVDHNGTLKAIALRSGYFPSQVTTFEVDWIVTPYAVLADNTLTFYYDNLMERRGGMEISTGISNDSIPLPWANSRYGIRSVVFDSSFAAYAGLTSTAGWFSGFSALTGITGLEYLNTSNVTDMSRMFDTCGMLTTLDLSSLDTRNVTNMEFMFDYCSTLESVNLDGISTSNVTSMHGMFWNCRRLTSLDIKGFDTRNVTRMSEMFNGCQGLTDLDLSRFNTESVTDMEFMFYRCSGLTSLDLGSFNTANVSDMEYMFGDCNSLTTIYAGNEWTTANVSMSNLMFTGCTSLVGGKGTVYDPDHVDYTYARIDGGTTAPGYFTLTGDTITYQMHFVNGSGWEKVYAYTWTESGASVVEYSGSFPGVELTERRDTVVNGQPLGIYTYTLVGHEAPANIIFSNGQLGGGDNQTADLPFVNGSTYAFNLPQVYEMQFVNGPEWDQVYAYTWRYQTENDSIVGLVQYDGLFPGVELTERRDTVVNGAPLGLYTYTLVGHEAPANIIFSNGQMGGGINQTRDLEFVNGSSYLAYTLDVTYEVAVRINDAVLLPDTTRYGFTVDAGASETLTFKPADHYYIDSLSVNGLNRLADLVANAADSTQTLLLSDIQSNTRVYVHCAYQATDTVAAPTFAWSGDELTLSTATAGAEVQYWLSDTDVNGDGVVTEDDYQTYTSPVTVARDVTIMAYATREGMLNSDTVTLVYDHTAWMRLLEAADYARNIAQMGMASPKRDRDIVMQFVNRLLATVEEAYVMFDMRTAEPAYVYEVADMLSMYASDLMNILYADEYAFDSSTGVLRVSGEANMTEALEAAGGRDAVAERVTAILWQVATPLTEDDLQGLDNPNLLIYVADEALAPENRDNVVANGYAKNVGLTDAVGGNNDFYCPQAFEAEMISYTRNFQQLTQVGVSRGWETLALPFTVQTVTNERNGLIAPFGNDSSEKHFWLRRLTSAGLAQATLIEANRPYLISMPNSAEYPAAYNQYGRVTFSSQNVEVPVTEPEQVMRADSALVFVPTFRRVAQADSVYVLNVGEQRGTYAEGSVFELGLRDVRPFEAYTLHLGTTHAPQFMPVSALSDFSTDIRELVVGQPQAADAVYDLQGRKVTRSQYVDGRLPKGVYIVNGRKTVIR